MCPSSRFASGVEAGLILLPLGQLLLLKKTRFQNILGLLKVKMLIFFKNLSEVCFVYIRCMICRLNKPNRSRFETIRSPFPNTSMTHCYVISSPKLMPKWAFLISFCRASVCLYVRLPVRPFVHFWLSLQNNWANFTQI